MVRKKTSGNQVSVGNITDVRGEVNVAGRDIIKNINTIYQRALTAAEEATRTRKQEIKLLAQGVARLVQNLSTRASAGTESDNPYKGLLPYGLNEAEIFHGRDKAKGELLNHIKQSPLTVLHAESGAGKSSLLQAGIAANLIANGHLAIYLRPHHADPADFIKQMFLPELIQAPSLTGAPLREFLRQVCAVLGSKTNLYLLLDQFEEFFHLLDKDERRHFLESLADCLNDPSLNVRWLLAVRAEALSDLSELEDFGIAPFRNMYRLSRLSLSEARLVISEPAKQHDISFAPALIEHILGTLTINEEVMPTHLQLVCSALVENLPEDKTLTLSYYVEHEGGTEGILRDYLKRQLEHLPATEQSLAWKVLRALITADRQRAVKTYDEITQELKTGGVSKQQIDTILVKLVERRLLQSQSGTSETFELAHDYLIQEIDIDPHEIGRKAAQELLDQEVRTYQRYKTLLTAEHLAVIEPHSPQLHFSPEAKFVFDESQKANLAVKRRRSAILVGVSAVAVIVAISMSILGVNAQRQATIAHAGELAALADSERDSNFGLALLFGVSGVQTRDNSRTESALLSLMDSHTGLERYLVGHRSAVLGIAFSPNGKLLASGGEDQIIILWDMSNPSRPSRLATLEGHDDSISTVSFSPDGKMLASGSDDTTVILWNVSNPAKPSKLAILEGHDDSVERVIFSADGKLLASGSEDNTIVLWDVSNPTDSSELATLEGHENFVEDIAFSPDGKMLASGSDDTTVILWNVSNPSNPSKLATLEGHQDIVWAVAFSPDSKTLVSGSRDKTIILWDISDPTSPSKLVTLLEHNDTVLSLAFSPDGKILVSGSRDKTIILWDMSNTASPQKLITLEGHEDSVECLAFSPDGSHLISGSQDQNIILWNIKNPTSPSKLATLSDHTDYVKSVAFTPDGRRLASGSKDKTIILWDISDPTSPSKLANWLGSDDVVLSIDFDPKGKLLASGGRDKMVTLWDVSSLTNPTKISTLEGHDDVILSIAFSPNGKLLASGSEDNTIILWDVSNPTDSSELATLEGHDEVVESVAFSPDGKMLASGSADNTVVLWNVSNPASPSKLTTLEGHNDSVYSVAFSPDGKRLASGGDDKTIILWDVSNAEDPSRLTTLEGIDDTVLSLAFSPGGSLLASGGRKKTITLWDISNVVSPQKLTVLTGHDDFVERIAFSPDGNQLASGSRDKKIILWDVNIQSLARHACEIVGRNFTRSEWAKYFPNEEYHAVCPQWPLD